jgi:hypothetical protein
LKNDGVSQWGWDDIPYMKWKIINVKKHQPDDINDINDGKVNHHK